MSSTKKLQKAAQKFRRENPALRAVCSALLSSMARFITKSGATEVTVGYDKYGKYYEAANN